jgi:8-oxo-dGTP diphosphatase
MVTMEKLPTSILVVAAAIVDARGRILLQQCAAHKRHAGKWEFPGGKVEANENQRFALKREVLEELGIELATGAMEPAGFAEDAQDSGGAELVMLLYTCTHWTGAPEGREGQRWGWYTLNEAAGLDMPPMDRTLLATMLRHVPG